MTKPDFFDTSNVRDDAVHWDMLAERMAANAAREPTASGFDWFARSRAVLVAATVLLAAALGFMLMPSSSSDPLSTDWVQSVAPADDVGRVMMLNDQPPAIGALLLAGQGAGAR